MQISELAQKNRRLKFWKEMLADSALTEAQKTEMLALLQKYQKLLNQIISIESAATGLVLEQDAVILLDIERKLEQLAEAARLESGKSALILD